MSALFSTTATTSNQSHSTGTSSSAKSSSSGGASKLNIILTVPVVVCAVVAVAVLILAYVSRKRQNARKSLKILPSSLQETEQLDAFRLVSNPLYQPGPPVSSFSNRVPNVLYEPLEEHYAALGLNFRVKLSEQASFDMRERGVGVDNMMYGDSTGNSIYTAMTTPGDSESAQVGFPARERGVGYEDMMYGDSPSNAVYTALSDLAPDEQRLTSTQASAKALSGPPGQWDALTLPATTAIDNSNASYIEISTTMDNTALYTYTEGPASNAALSKSA